MKIVFIFGIIILLLGVSVTPSIGISNNDDTTPPVTTHSLDPSEPDGLNGWYVNDVNVTLIATDDMSGVKEIRYTIDGSSEYVIPGDNGSFILYEDGLEIWVEYWAIDNAGNVESRNSFYIDIDQTEPDIHLYYSITGGNWWQGLEYTFTARAEDGMSDMERVEFYVHGILQETVYGVGPEYCWVLQSHFRLDNPVRVRGLIFKPEITEEYVSFYAIIVRISKFMPLFPNRYPVVYADAYDNAGNYKRDEIQNPCNTKSIESGIYLFESLILPNNYTGFIGDNFIFATFCIK